MGHKSVICYYDDEKNSLAIQFIKPKSKDPYSRKLSKLKHGALSAGIQGLWQQFSIDLPSVVGSYIPQKDSSLDIGTVHYIKLSEEGKLKTKKTT